MAKKNIHTKVIEVQTQINDMIANGVTTSQEKNALKKKNDYLKYLIKEIKANKKYVKKQK
jgi:hypothetical protein